MLHVLGKRQSFASILQYSTNSCSAEECVHIDQCSKSVQLPLLIPAAVERCAPAVLCLFLPEVISRKAEKQPIHLVKIIGYFFQRRAKLL